VDKLGLDWIVQCFTSPSTQYRLYGRRFYRSKDPTNGKRKEPQKETRSQAVARIADRTASQKTLVIIVIVLIGLA